MATDKPQGSVRAPVVAGAFYPSDRDELFESVHRTFTHFLGPGRFPKPLSSKEPSISSDMIQERAECLVVPHAGYMYSGPVAAHSYLIANKFFNSFKSSQRILVVILGPNHYGIGSGVALSPADWWETPLGRLKIDSELIRRIAKNSSIMDLDELGHSREHSIEVQLPFIQAISGTIVDKLSIVPVSLMLQDVDTAKEIAEELFDAVKSTENPVLFIGSSDLTHYESSRAATEKDTKLLKEVERIDLLSFYNVLERLNISSCGYGAIASVMQISKKLGKTKGHILKYATSGDTTGDLSAVVGYPSVHFT